MKEAILRSGIDRRTLLTTLALLPAATNMTHRDLPSTGRIVGIPNLDRSVESMVIA
jgi:hypothetical protein